MRRTALALMAVVLAIFLVSAAISVGDQIASWIVNMFGMAAVAVWAVFFFSTIPERVLLFVTCSIALGASFFAARFLRSLLVRFLLPVLAAFVLFLGLYHTFPRSHPIAVALSLALLVAISQLAPFLPYLRGRAEQTKGIELRITVWLPSTILVSALAVVVSDGRSLIGLARKLHADKAVQQFAEVELNALAVDTEQGLLFATGPGTDYLLGYNLNALDEPPGRSEVEVGRTHRFYYHPLYRELYIFNEETRTLLVLDATTLTLKKSVSLNVGPCDCWIVYDSHTDSIIIVSEGKEEGISPFAVVRRATGELLYTLERCGGGICVPWNIFLHPSRPLLYLGFRKKLLAYDTKRRKIVADTNTGNRWIDRMAMTPALDELLVAAPVSSAVLKFDADTLEPKGRINTVFGVRTLTIDPVRNLLLTGSMVTNRLDVIDLKRNARVAQYYVAPWLRTIALDTRAGIAYVSSTEGLFRVDYTAGLSPRE